MHSIMHHRVLLVQRADRRTGHNGVCNERVSVEARLAKVLREVGGNWWVGGWGI